MSTEESGARGGAIGSSTTHDTGDLHVRLATPDDAERIAGLIVSQYGTGYAERSYVDPAALRARLGGDDVRFAVALIDGQVVGQMAVERRSRYLWEFARALVRPEHRGRHVLAALDAALLEQALLPDRTARFFFARSVTHHVVSQRHARRVGAAPLGMLLGHWPASAIESPVDDAPVSALITGKALAPMRPRRLAFGGAARALAERLLAAHGVGVSSGAVRVGRRLGFERSESPALGLVHLRIGAHRPGSLALLEDEVSRGEDAGARLVWVDVPAEHPQAGALVHRLERMGFSFGAYFPFGGTSSEDVVRMQRYLGRPFDPAGIQMLDEFRPVRDAVVAAAEAARLAVHK